MGVKINHLKPLLFKIYPYAYGRTYAIYYHIHETCATIGNKKLVKLIAHPIRKTDRGSGCEQYFLLDPIAPEGPSKEIAQNTVFS